MDPTFGPWFWGNLTSNLGNWLFNVTAAVLVFDLTGSSTVVGLVSVAQFLPLVLLAGVTGDLSDRYDRRMLMLAGQLVAAVAAAGVTTVTLVRGVASSSTVPALIVGAVAIGLGMALADPARSSLVPSLVADDELESGVALTALTFVAGRAIGPVIAGVLLVAGDAGTAFVANTVSFLPLLVVLHRMAPAPGGGAGGSLSRLAGLRWVVSDRPSTLVLVGVVAAGFAADPVVTLGPQLASEVGGETGDVAWLVGSFGVSGALAGLSSGSVQRWLGGGRTAGVGMLLVAVGHALAATAPGMGQAVLGFGVAGGGLTLAATSFTALLQRRLPDGLRGRVMALWGVAYLGSRPVAALVDGLLGDALGPRPALLLGVAAALVGIAVARRLRADRVAAAGGPAEG